jgi:hypothetical protein
VRRLTSLHGIGDRRIRRLHPPEPAVQLSLLPGA